MISRQVPLWSTLVLTCACAAPPPPPPLTALRGRVVDASGRPLADVPVRIHAGLATRWRTGETRTDANGRFEFVDPQGSARMLVDGATWATFVGVSVGETVDALNPAAYLPWRDVTIPPGETVTVDVVFDRQGIERRIAELRDG